jgi:hypothetical protein
MGTLAWRAPLVVLLIGVAGCSADTGSSPSPRGGAAHGPSVAAAARSQTPAKSREKPKSSRHHRHAAVARSSPSPSAQVAPTFVSCDANISVRAATTTCPFAENVFYELFQATAGYISATTVRAWSPATRRFYSVHCSGGRSIVCTAGDGGEVRFPSEAMDAYDDSQAARYASTHETGPSQVSDENPNSSTSGSSEISTTDADTVDFCATHDCIPNYDEGTGYQVQCADGTWSHSGGRPGACSWHGGVG